MIIKDYHDRVKDWVNDKTGWELWFAWHPVYPNENDNTMVWLETVRRKRCVVQRRTLGVTDDARGYKYEIIGKYNDREMPTIMGFTGPTGPTGKP